MAFVSSARTGMRTRAKSSRNLRRWKNQAAARSRSSAGLTLASPPSLIGSRDATSPSCTISRALRAIGFPPSAGAVRSRSQSGIRAESVVTGKRNLLQEVRSAAEAAMREADVILFIVDAQQGLTPIDQELARLLRRSKRPVVLVVNKIDHPKHEDLDLRVSASRLSRASRSARRTASASVR